MYIVHCVHYVHVFMSQFIIVSDLKAPEDFNGEHDIEGFWNSIHLEMISRGFFPSE